ncbi:sensor histidine kinase [Flavobacterium sp.]|uniref:sensor histidine kinase n=1 Tax=Flavobacterium sp. TaxID=239 RepID=UPI003752A969
MRIVDADELSAIKSKVLLNLGNLYIVQKDTVKGLKYYNDNIENAKKYSLNTELSKAYISVAILYVATNKQIASQYYFKALAIVKKNKDLATEFIVHIGLSELYLSDKKNIKLKECFYHLQKASVIQQLIKDELMLFNVSFNYGGYYLKKKQYTTSLQYYYKALEVTKKNITSDQKLNLYDAISKCYIYNNDYKNGLLFKEKFNSLKDSIFNVNKINTFNEIETKYNVDNKNLKIKLLTKDKELQQNTKRTIILVSLILLILSITIVFYLRQRIKIQKILSFKRQKIYNQEIVRLEQEKELKRINGILEGQELERKRLAIEIHDGIGGTLAGIKLQLSQENSLIKNKKIDVVINKMSIAFSELRAISHNLNYDYLKNKNLEILIHQLAKEYNNRKQFKVNVSIFPENSLELLSNISKHTIYRIIQELLTNVFKHAKANQVTISFTSHINNLNIIFEDDGVGFKKNKVDGMGIKNCKERILSLNGKLIIESSKGIGTTLIMDIPTNE